MENMRNHSLNKMWTRCGVINDAGKYQSIPYLSHALVIRIPVHVAKGDEKSTL